MEGKSTSISSVVTPRRSTRIRKPNPLLANSESLNVIENIEDDEFLEEEKKERPIVLHNNEKVQGGQIFAFHKRKSRNSLFNKVTETHNFDIPKTPHQLREKLKKKIAAKIVEENSSSEHDFSDSGSEYVATESSDDDDDDNDSEEKEIAMSEDAFDSDANDHRPSKLRQKTAKLIPTSKSQQVSHKKNKNYLIKTDDFFTNNASKKIITSNHTLDKLDTPRLPQDQLQKLLSKMKISKEHRQCVRNLFEANCGNFNKWLYLLHENFNILLYGLGSKKDILQEFHEQCLNDLPVVVVNGFFPSLTIKEILDGIVGDMLELKEVPSNVYETCELIEEEFKKISDIHLYIIVHNIEMIRGTDAQNAFAHLAKIRNIHLIASIDHINAPLVWGHANLSKLNFTWWDVTSYHPYLAETAFESSLMVQNSGALALSSLRNVFLSLTSNSKGIYLILVKYQLENGKNQYYQGLSFKDLYTSCREAFLVSSDLALRAQLTEFVDHKMVKIKRSIDGTENLVIPISDAVLQQFLHEQNN